MRRLFFLILFLFGIFQTQAQLNNEWIDYSKIYYKCKVGTTGLHRIHYTTLQQAGLSNVPMEHFQLFRNGVEVPIFTSKKNGIATSSDYIEFFGKQNDGIPDARFYKQSSLQINSSKSLLTDTAAYFLTVNSTGIVARIDQEGNAVSSNTLSPESSFIYTYVKSFQDKLNEGFAYVSGAFYIYSSSYEQGEGWTSRDINPSSPLSETFNLYPATTSGDASLSITYSGNAPNNRNIEISLNNKPLFEETINGFTMFNKNLTIPMSELGKDGGDILIARNKSTNGTDRVVIGEVKITYPRKFNFGGASVFEFTLPSNTSGTYLEISNFNHGNTSPVLMDITNQKRYIGVLENGLVKFALKASPTSRDLVLLSSEANSVREINQLETKKFTDYSKVENQKDYVIISNKRLYTSATSPGNPVENYRAFRASADGGGYNAGIFDIDELVDQFGFGIRWNPLSIKNFIQFARTKFSLRPKYIFLIGRGILYTDGRRREQLPVTHEMNLVPTFGSPGSDNLLVSPGYDVDVDIPVGRLAAISGAEVEVYLQKIKQHETGKISAGSSMKDRAWRKNIVHAIGGTDPFLQSILTSYMNTYRNIAKDTSIGANVHTFSKAVNISTDLLTSEQLSKLFNEGISMLTFFGHSATEVLEFNIDEPEAYNNQGKYPFFIVNGCYAGNIFIYDTVRVRGRGFTISERYNMAKERGSIGFLAHAHVGVVNYLDIFTNAFYTSFSKSLYGKPYGDVQKATLILYNSKLSSTDYLGRTHLEQMVLHADPALSTPGYALPDYIVEDPMVSVSPNPVSVADKEFTLKVRYANIGKVIRDSIRILIQRRLPDGSIVDVFNKKVQSLQFQDSLYFNIPINPIAEKGTNRIMVTLDSDNKVAEQSEINNSIYKDFTILEDEIRPIYPLNYAIVNQPVKDFYASAANPNSPLRTYQMEIDTTELFNSSAKVTASAQVEGSLVKFATTGINWKDSTVYYWRTAPVQNTGQTNWSHSSFMYLMNNPAGFGQAHYYQMLKSNYDSIHLKADRSYSFDTIVKKLSFKTGLAPRHTGNKLLVTLDANITVNWGCRAGSLQIVVLDPKTLAPWPNSLQADGLGRFGSWTPCDRNEQAFEFPYYDPVFRKRAIDFLESLPDGVVFSITNFSNLSNSSFVSDWKTDTSSLGSNRSLYHTLKKLGFTDIDNFTQNLPFLFVSKKNGQVIHQQMGENVDSYIEEYFYINSFVTSGKINSPWFGPATSWSRLKWSGKELQPFSDEYNVDLFGKDKLGQETLLFSTKNIDTSLTSLDAKKYPFVRMQLRLKDSVFATPYQLRYWMLTGMHTPEGAIASEYFKTAKDTVEAGETYPFEMAFKNISSTPFDSLDVKLTITNTSNVTTDIPLKKLKPISQGDTAVVRYLIDTRKLAKDNLIFVNFNPDGIQSEQHLFNNFLYRSVFVKADEYKPVLDVTFDGIRILNEDIVSSKPRIHIKLTDNSKYLMLDDTSLMTIKIRYPNNQVRMFRFDNDTVRFTPAVFSNGVKENAATIDFLPFFKEDGMYELIVTGTDKSANSSGVIDYKIAFNVVNKPMISHLLNYPNPFTTSTAFVFTLTGSQVPQNMRIQILTITGKIVREITKDELGPIRIGRNITEYKWDGTDQFGQKLANGVYLYRVITNLNGKSIDQLGAGTGGYNFSGEEKYFTNGYGKMYLMR